MSDVEKSDNWPLWEIFIQSGKGGPHVHAGSVHAPDEIMALQNGRDTFARREKVTGLWAVKTELIASVPPEDGDPYFHQSFDTPYRHPQFYRIPRQKKNNEANKEKH